MSYLVKSVTANEVTMEYLTFGEGRQPLVILPGLSVQSVLPAAAAIEQQYALFQQDFTVYLFERRKNLPPVYTVRDMARDTATVMAALRLENVCLFGVSQGGMIAMMVAAEYPELVQKLALGSTACRMDDARYAAIRRWSAYAAENDSEQLYLSFGEKVYPKAFFTKHREAFAMMAKTVTQADLARFIVLAEGTKDFDATAQLAALSCPVLLLGSSDDAVLGAEAATEMVRILKGHSRLSCHIYDGYGHAAYDLAPDYTQRLYRFFGGDHAESAEKE